LKNTTHFSSRFNLVMFSLKPLALTALVSMSMNSYADPTVTEFGAEFGAKIGAELGAAPVTELNFQDDYICNAKPGEFVTSGTLDFATSKDNRFGFTYPVKVNKIWVTETGKTDWKANDLTTEFNLAAYKGVRFDMNWQTKNCQAGSVATTVNNEGKETLVTATVCAPKTLQTAQVQVIFEALN